MLRLFKRNALVGFRNFGVSLALCLTAHRKIHSNFRAFTGEVSTESFHNLFVFHLTVTDVMLGRPGQLGGVFLLFDELRGRGFALGAEFGSGIAFMDITADSTYKLLHFQSPFKCCCSAGASPAVPPCPLI